MASFTKNLAVFGLAIVLSLSLLSPKMRQLLIISSNPQARVVLATLEFPIHGEVYKVVKLKSGTNILIEIYKQKDNHPALYATFDFQEKKDVFYDFRTSVTNLFIANIDEDQINEILVPVIGKNLDSQLNVIKYSPETKKFAVF